MVTHTPRSRLFPYTTLFRSPESRRRANSAATSSGATSATIGAAAAKTTVTSPLTARDSSWATTSRSEEHTSELQSRVDLVCRLLLEKKKHQLKEYNPDLRGT